MYCTLKHLREFVITTPKQTVPLFFLVNLGALNFRYAIICSLFQN